MECAVSLNLKIKKKTKVIDAISLILQLTYYNCKNKLTKIIKQRGLTNRLAIGKLYKKY
jgi:hypothetical protein